MSKESNESPIVSFRVPLNIVEKLQRAGKLKSDYSKSELSNLIKNEWLAIAGEEIPVSIDARTVDRVDTKVDAVHSRLDEILRLLQGKPQAV